jgi:hypothetical protein
MKTTITAIIIFIITSSCSSNIKTVYLDYYIPAESQVDLTIALETYYEDTLEHTRIVKFEAATELFLDGLPYPPNHPDPEVYLKNGFGNSKCACSKPKKISEYIEGESKVFEYWISVDIPQRNIKINESISFNPNKLQTYVSPVNPNVQIKFKIINP